MRRHLIALIGAVAVLLALGAGAAQAQSVQGVEQIAATGQSANSNATSTQVRPTNSNIDVRIFSPGDNGSVSQSNTSTAAAGAINAAQTDQAAEQSQSGGGGGEQAIGQGAATGQHAEADATSKQINPTNSNISVRIHSRGDNGDVSQSNDSTAGALAGNAASTTQDASQDQGGGCCSGGAGVQAVGQEAGTFQHADAEARSEQYHPTNSNISVRIGSRGDNGSVTQSNSSAAKALAGNSASTDQTADQSQRGCGCGGDRVQAVGQEAITGQKADADAKSIQAGAKNSNVPVRIFSSGDDGDVTQSNDSKALSGAFNLAATTQTVDQRQGGGCGCRHGSDHGGGGGDAGARVQAVGQLALTGQKANADAKSLQLHPTNTNAPLRIKSKGDGGYVDQSNASRAAAFSLNLAGTTQWVGQEQ